MTEDRREYYKEWHKKNPDWSKDWYQQHRDESLQRGSQWKKDHPEKSRESCRKWYKNSADKERIYERNQEYRAKKYEATIGIISIDDHYNDQGGLCFYCGISLNGAYHLEHKIPISRNGSHSQENTCLACPKCNWSKNNLTPKEWLGE